MGGCDWNGIGLEVYRAGGLLRRDVSIDYVAAFGGGLLAYLATPYSGHCRDAQGAFLRAQSINCIHTAAFWQRRLAVRGLTAVSPVVHRGLIVEADQGCATVDPLDGDFWHAWQMPMLRKSDLVVVPPVAGWDRSRGVWRAAIAALRAQVPVLLIRGAEA